MSKAAKTMTTWLVILALAIAGTWYGTMTYYQKQIGGGR